MIALYPQRRNGSKEETMQKKKSTLLLAQMAILIALQAVMTFTPLGFILVPPVSITLMHIPVIVGAILMGPVRGGILGASFGIFAMIKASTAAASPMDLAFSPFLSGEPVASIVLCILPRILLGVVAGLLFAALRKRMKGQVPAIAISGIVATFCHSFLVLGLLSLLFSALPLKQVLALVVGVNCLLEMLAAGIIATAICKPLLRLQK